MGLAVDRQELIRRTLATIDDPQERLTAALDWKSALDPLREEERVEENRVRGCMSRVWLAANVETGRCRFRVDSDSVLVRGLVTLLCGIYDGVPPEEVVAVEPEVMEEVGIVRNLSPTRQNGLAAVRHALVDFATKAM